jgi:hypothetical protein
MRSGALEQFRLGSNPRLNDGDERSDLQSGFLQPLPVHSTVIGIRPQDARDRAVIPRCAGELLFELRVAQFGDELQRGAARRGRQGDDLAEGVVAVGHLPLFGRGIHDDHDVGASTGLAEVVVQESDGIRFAGEVSLHHGGEIAFDQRQVGEVIERRPMIFGIVLALGEWLL